MNRYYFLIIAVFLTMATLLAGCRQETARSPIIVKVGDAEFTLDDLRLTVPVALRDSLSKDDLEEYVNRWINAQVLYQNGLAIGLGKQVEIRRRVQDFETKLVGSTFLDSALKTRVQISDDEIAAYYEENKDIFVRNREEVQLKHMLLADKKTATAVWRQLRRKADFDTLALKHDPDQSPEMRDLGYVDEDEIMETIWTKLKIVRPGNVTRPVETKFGWHIFKVLDRKKEGSIKPLADVNTEIRARLKQDKLEEQYLALLSQLKSAIHIETRFDLLNRLPMDSIFVQPATKLVQSK